MKKLIRKAIMAFIRPMVLDILEENKPDELTPDDLRKPFSQLWIEAFENSRYKITP